MTSHVISNLPVMVGRAVIRSLGAVLSWLFAKIVSNPLLSAIVIIMGVGSAASMNNALFLQKQAHPSPFFAPKHEMAVIAPIPQVIKPVVLAEVTASQPASLPLQPSAPILAPTPATSQAVAKIDHGQVVLMQKKLASFGFFNEVADGYYGPKTAAAIRAFERSVGKKPVGAITPEILRDILSAKISSTSPIVEMNIKPMTRPSAHVSANNLIEDPIMQIVRNAVSNNNAVPVGRVQNVDEQMIKNVQLGLVSLGFLYGKVDGVVGESTSRAIREFEVFHNYEVSGKVSPELLDMLIGAGAKI